MKIENCTQLIKEWVGHEAETEQEAKALAEKWCFKYTDCGCVFGCDPDGITVAGYAEGSDAELPPYHLDWGFTIKEFNDALDQADADGVEEWNACNEADWT
mgnify:CR=1 FL=1